MLLYHTYVFTKGFRILKRTASAQMFVWFLAKEWAEANRTKLVFEATNKYWLDGNFVIPIKPSLASQDDR